jgi:hypothetical protein
VQLSVVPYQFTAAYLLLAAMFIIFSFTKEGAKEEYQIT